MESRKGLIRFLSDTEEKQFLPNISIDCVVLGFHDGHLKVLLLRFTETDLYALPGGFVRQEESLDEAAYRILAERTGLQNIYLRQFHTFGDPARRNDATHRQIMAVRGLALPDSHWLFERFISVGYYALVDFSEVHPKPDDFSDAADWYELEALPPLVFDHNQIVDKALSALRLSLEYAPVGVNLLPEVFTMADLQRLYETILGTRLLRTNFQRKMLSMNLLERVDKKRTGKAHKAPYLYRFVTRTFPDGADSSSGFLD